MHAAAVRRARRRSTSTTGRDALGRAARHPACSAGRRADRAPRGSPNLGGPIVTAGGLVFIGATLDRAFRAFDVETGRELWKAPLPAGARATPMTYARADGSTSSSPRAGGDGWGEGDYIVAFALPAR